MTISGLREGRREDGKESLSRDKIAWGVEERRRKPRLDRASVILVQVSQPSLRRRKEGVCSVSLPRERERERERGREGRKI
jgi:hypothetical protein